MTAEQFSQFHCFKIRTPSKGDLCRGLFRILSNIYDEFFCENILNLKSFNYFLKTFHHRRLRGPLLLYAPYSEFFWSAFSVFSLNARKCGPEKPRIRTLFTQSWINLSEKLQGFRNGMSGCRSALSQSFQVNMVEAQK